MLHATFILFSFDTLITLGKEYKESTDHCIMQFSPACYFLSLRYKYFPQHPILEHPDSKFFL